MLSSFSWNIFFTTTAFLATVYYVITTLLLYRSEIIYRVKSRRADARAKPSTRKSQPESPGAQGIMGAVN